LVIKTFVENSHEKPTVTDSSDKDTDHDAVTDSDRNDDGVQHFIGKDGSSWRILSTFQVQRGHLQHQNVVNVRPAPTEFATNRVIEGSPTPCNQRQPIHHQKHAERRLAVVSTCNAKLKCFVEHHQTTKMMK